MTVERLSVKTGLTLNLGNYESARVDVGAEAAVEEGEDPRACYHELFRMCELEMVDQVRGIQSQIAERVRNAASR